MYQRKDMSQARDIRRPAVALMLVIIVFLKTVTAIPLVGTPAFDAYISQFLSKNSELTTIINSTINNVFEYRQYDNSIRVPNKYLVVLKEMVPIDVVEKIKTALPLLGCQVSGEFKKLFRGFTVTVDGSLPVDILRKIPYIETIEEDHIWSYPKQVQPLNNEQWGLDRLDEARFPLDRSFVFDSTGKGVNIYFIDSGIDINHVEIRGRAQHAFVGSGQGLQKDGRSPRDCTGHGTHVSSIAAGTNVGVAKLSNVYSLRVIDCEDISENSDILAALEWVATNYQLPAIINLSLGPKPQAGGVYTKEPAVDNAIKNLLATGVTVVAAAGNDNLNACTATPAGVPGVITVAATDQNDNRASFSNFGECIDIFAPGDKILSAEAYGTYAFKSGTSQATPFVAGVAATFLQKNPTAKASDVLNGLRSAAVQNAVGNPQSPNFLLQALSVPPPNSPNALAKFVELAPLSTIVPGQQQNGLLGISVGYWVLISVSLCVVIGIAIFFLIVRRRGSKSGQQWQDSIVEFGRNARSTLKRGFNDKSQPIQQSTLLDHSPPPNMIEQPRSPVNHQILLRSSSPKAYSPGSENSERSLILGQHGQISRGYNSSAKSPLYNSPYHPFNHSEYSSYPKSPQNDANRIRDHNYLQSSKMMAIQPPSPAHYKSSKPQIRKEKYYLNEYLEQKSEGRVLASSSADIILKKKTNPRAPVRADFELRNDQLNFPTLIGTKRRHE